jgi:hypothetical protein
MTSETEITIIKKIIDETGAIDIKVDSQVGSETALIVLLLHVVETMTGVSTDDYVKQVDEARIAPSKE